MIEDWEPLEKNSLTSSFTPMSEVVVIPKSSYQPKKSCPFCHSYYLTDTHCEACGKSLVFDPVGEPFSAKSFFAIKERYIEEFDVLKRFFPVFESIHSQDAQKYLRRLKKRLIDLLDYFQFREAFYDEKSLQERKIFFIECQFIIEELLNYDEPIEEILKIIEVKSSGVLGEELARYSLELTRTIVIDKRSLWQKLGDQKILGTIKLSAIITTFLLGGSLIGASLYFKFVYFNS